MKAVSDLNRPIAKIGVLPAMGLYPWNLASPVSPQPRRNATVTDLATRAYAKPRGTLRRKEQRHSFAIESLPRDPKSSSRSYLYMCVRCKWTFRVNDRPTSIVPIDQDGAPLAEPENGRRVATFALGPCPALKALARHHAVQAPASNWRATTRHRSGRILLAMWRRWSGEDGRGARPDPQATIRITAQDLIR